MATSDFLFGGSTPSAYGGQVVENATMPAWYQEAIRGLVTKQSHISGQDYQPYGGQRLAGQTTDQISSNDMTRNLATQGNPFATQASDLISKGSGAFNQEDFNSYLNPYSDQLNDVIAQRGQRNFDENVAPTINNSFIGAGMFGGSRNADKFTTALRDSEQSILDAQTSNLNTNYNNAMSAYQTGREQNLNAGNALSTLGQQQFQTGLASAAALAGIGGQQQAQNQAGLDLAYNDFQSQRDYPQTQLNNLNNMIRGLQPAAASTTTTVNPMNYQTASPLSSVLGSLSQASLAGNTQK